MNQESSETIQSEIPLASSHPHHCRMGNHTEKPQHSLLELIGQSTEHDLAEFSKKSSILGPVTAQLATEFFQDIQGRSDYRKALINLILKADNKTITYFYLLFLDASKTRALSPVTIPAVLRNEEHRALFWKLVFQSKDREKFDTGFQKLILSLAGAYPKKQVFELINFGTGLWRFRAHSQR